VRELTITTLEESPTRLATGKGGACVRLGASRGVPVSLVPRTVRFDPNPRIFGNRLDGCPRGGTLPCAYVYLARFKSIDFRPLTVIRD
jgi:hypothetical protein